MICKEDILSIVSLASKQYFTETKRNKKTDNEVLSGLFSYFDNYVKESTIHHCVIHGLSSKTTQSNSREKKKKTLAETLPFYIQQFGIGEASYFGSVSYSFRSKKNNRPIHVKRDAVNSLKSSEVQAMINLRKKNPSTRSSSMAKIVKRIAITGKDDFLRNQEKTLGDMLNIPTNFFWKLTVKDYYERSAMRILICKEIHKHIYTLDENVLRDKDFFSLFFREIDDIIDKHGLLDLCYYVDTKNLCGFVKKKYQSHDVQVSVAKVKPKKDLFDYQKNLVFLSDTIHQHIKRNELGLRDSYALYGDWKKLGETMWFKNLWLMLYKRDKDIAKRMCLSMKSIHAGWNFKTGEYVYNSFLMQPDLSNSLELLQDVYEKYLNNNGIGFNDRYYSPIIAEIGRIPVQSKKDSLLQNVFFFSSRR